jgi:hypothetical protein
MVFGELYRNGAEWKFGAIGQGYASGLRGIAQDFGVYAGCTTVSGAALLCAAPDTPACP